MGYEENGKIDANREFEPEWALNRAGILRVIWNSLPDGVAFSLVEPLRDSVYSSQRTPFSRS